MNILLLEDDKALNKAICKTLTNNQYSVEQFYDGNSVIENYDEKYDLFILDINVPNTSGIELLELIKNKNPKAKIIIISANNNLHTIKHSYKLGCIDYIKKPFFIEELLYKIKVLIPNNKADKYIKDNITLTKTEESFFKLLKQNQNQTIRYEDIQNIIYQEKESTNINTIRTLAKRVRAKLKNKDLIKTVNGFGFKFQE
jgi:DNA-binding response OmpR family regulator